MQRNGLKSGVPANFKGKKGRSGRKPIYEEFQMAIGKEREKIKSEAIIELANSIGFKCLQQLAEKEVISPILIKELVLPIMLKGMTEKLDNTISLKSKNKKELEEELSKKITELLKKK